MLEERDSFADKVNIYIIQCDDAVREVVNIREREEFDRYIKTMEIKGLGRTGFRPVFEYVDELICERKLTDLRGLIYFTDGKGIFPSKVPGYEVAFIICSESPMGVRVPEWAIRLDLPEEEIMKL